MIGYGLIRYNILKCILPNAIVSDFISILLTFYQCNIKIFNRFQSVALVQLQSEKESDGCNRIVRDSPICDYLVWNQFLPHNCILQPNINISSIVDLLFFKFKLST